MPGTETGGVAIATLDDLLAKKKQNEGLGLFGYVPGQVTVDSVEKLDLLLSMLSSTYCPFGFRVLFQLNSAFKENKVSSMLSKWLNGDKGTSDIHFVFFNGTLQDTFNSILNALMFRPFTKRRFTLVFEPGVLASTEILNKFIKSGSASNVHIELQGCHLVDEALKQLALAILAGNPTQFTIDLRNNLFTDEGLLPLLEAKDSSRWPSGVKLRLSQSRMSQLRFTKWQKVYDQQSMGPSIIFFQALAPLLSPYFSTGLSSPMVLLIINYLLEMPIQQVVSLDMKTTNRLGFTFFNENLEHKPELCNKASCLKEFQGLIHSRMPDYEKIGFESAGFREGLLKIGFKAAALAEGIRIFTPASNFAGHFKHTLEIQKIKSKQQDGEITISTDSLDAFLKCYTPQIDLSLLVNPDENQGKSRCSIS